MFHCSASSACGSRGAAGCLRKTPLVIHVSMSRSGTSPTYRRLRRRSPAFAGASASCHFTVPAASVGANAAIAIRKTACWKGIVTLKFLQEISFLQGNARRQRADRGQMLGQGPRLRSRVERVGIEHFQHAVRIRTLGLVRGPAVCSLYDAVNLRSAIARDRPFDRLRPCVDLRLTFWLPRSTFQPAYITAAQQGLKPQLARSNLGRMVAPPITAR